jgi:DNA-binding transcriptional MerR regulator
METQYSLKQLAELTGIEPRTIRWYISEGLLRGPEAMGRNAYYTDYHRKRLATIQELRQTYNMPVAEIRKYLLMARDDEDIQIVPVWPGQVTERPVESSMEYRMPVVSSPFSNVHARRIPEHKAKSRPLEAESPFQRLLDQLRNLISPGRLRRVAKATPCWEIEILPDISLRIRGAYDPSEIARFEQLADHLRALLLDGDEASDDEQ